jgi:hypothetical protein
MAALLVSAPVASQMLPGAALPPISLPTPLPSAPVAGPLLQDVLGQPQAQQVIRPTLNSVAGLPESVAQAGPSTLLDLRRMRLQEMIRENRATVEPGERGEPVRRSILIAVDPDPWSLQMALRGGFRIIADETEPQLGMRVVQLRVPGDLGVRSAIKRIRKIAPRLQVDYDQIFEPAGGSLNPVNAALAASAGSGAGRIIGMIDGGVASHPSLAKASIEQSGFAGAPQPTGHGTAVASLLVGSQGPFRGAATGAQLYVADVYGGNRAAGSATAIVKALGWLAGHRAQVINISLVGPENRAVARAIRILQARGIQIVAAVGNDGPAAPPQFPASYPGVVAVTAVDSRGKAIPEAGKAAHLDFAAPGADMAAATPGDGYARVRGTSFAAPLAAARLSIVGSPKRLAAEAKPGSGRVGQGIVCASCRIAPRAVGAK